MIKKLSNIYIAAPLLFDLILIGILIGLIEMICSKYQLCISEDREAVTNLLHELVSSSVSVGGFIIASLTIILTMKDNLKSKNIEDSETGLELILLSKHYVKIVGIFFWAIIIFILTFFYFSLIEILNLHISDKVAMYLVFAGLMVIIMCLLRCLMVLKKIIVISSKEAKPKEEW